MFIQKNNSANTSSSLSELLQTNTKSNDTLKKEVENYLETDFQLQLDHIRYFSDPIINEWLEELEKEGSHLSSFLLASEIADLARS